MTHSIIGSLRVLDKGTNTPLARGDVRLDGVLTQGGSFTQQNSTATLTALQCVSGTITVNTGATTGASDNNLPGANGNVVLTLPSTASLLAAIPVVAIGDAFTLNVVNHNSPTNTITINAAVPGYTVNDATPATFKVIPGRSSMQIQFVATNVTLGSEAFTLY